MSKSEMTKELLANSLKTHMKIMPLDKITIKTIVEDCNVNRQTFYYHFSDIYDLLEWILKNEIDKVLNATQNYTDWKKGAIYLADYILTNKEVCLCAYNSKGKEYIEKVIFQYLNFLLKQVIYALANDYIIDDTKKDFMVKFYSLAIYGLIDDWLKTNMKEDINDILSNLEDLFEDTILYNIQKYDKKD